METMKPSTGVFKTENVTLIYYFSPNSYLKFLFCGGEDDTEK